MPSAQCYRADHGFNGGLERTADLSSMEGLNTVSSSGELAAFAAAYVPDCIGVTHHPDFFADENPCRVAVAILWYTHLSPVEQCWPLYLFDEGESAKPPGAPPSDAAVAAAETVIASHADTAAELVAQSGDAGVELELETGGYLGLEDEAAEKSLALAILRQGSFIRHAGSFSADPNECLGCRNVMLGSPFACSLGMHRVPHWTCCGSTDAMHTACEAWSRYSHEPAVCQRIEAVVAKATAALAEVTPGATEPVESAVA